MKDLVSLTPGFMVSSLFDTKSQANQDGLALCLALVVRLSIWRHLLLHGAKDSNL
jgi:hypothetical protein